MQAKEKLIIEAAIKLFSVKGFDATSIQDIAKECGMAKGSFYSYFNSKDTLLLETLNYYFAKIESRIKTVDEMNLESREKFIKQLAFFFEGVFEHKEFIITQAYEQAIPLNETVKKALFQKQNQTREFYRSGLQSIYGEKISPHLWDLSIMLEGMFHAYIRMFLIDEKGLNINELASYIVKRMDDIVNGLITSKEKPMFTEREIKHLTNVVGLTVASDKARMNEIIYKMKSEIEQLKNHEDLLISLEVLEEEFARENPREPVIFGMLSNLKGQTRLKNYINELKYLRKF